MEFRIRKGQNGAAIRLHDLEAEIMFTISSMTFTLGMVTNPFLSASGWRGSYTV